MKKKAASRDQGRLGRAVPAKKSSLVRRKGPRPSGPGSATPMPEQLPIENDEDDTMEIHEEDRAFVEEHSSFAASFLDADPRSPTPAGSAGKSKRAHTAPEDNNGGVEVPIEQKSMRRKASTLGWNTARGIGHRVVKERLPTKTIDGKLHFRLEEVEEIVEDTQKVNTVVSARKSKEKKDNRWGEVEQGEEKKEEEGEEEEEEEKEEEEEEEDVEDDVNVAMHSETLDPEVLGDSRPKNGREAKNRSGSRVVPGQIAAEAESLSVEAFGGDVRAMRRARLELKKTEIATLCEAILENPEGGLLGRSAGGGWRGRGSRMGALLGALEDQDKQVQVWAMASLVAVFRDLAPAYRIRLPTEKELQVKASKEVKRTQEYERVLLASYKAYLKYLERTSHAGRASPSGKPQVSPAGREVRRSVAAKCLCELLTALSHFNFTTSVLTAVIRLGMGPDPPTRTMAGAAVRRLLERDQQGDVSLSATKLICKEMQHRRLQAPEDMLRALHALKLVVKEDEAVEVLRKARVHATKRKSQQLEEEEEDGESEVRTGLREAEARADPELRARCQSESLQEVTILYFRVLKQARKPTLLPAALEGLSRVAHLINLDTVVDVLEVLKDMLDPTRNLPLGASLHAVLTALRTLQGPGRELRVDDKAFLTFLYQLLGRVGMGLAADSHQDEKRTDARSGVTIFPLLVTCLRKALLERREFSLARVAAFYKRLLGLALQLTSPQESQVVLGIVKELPTRYPGLEQMLDGETDRVAMGVYRPDTVEPEMSNPLASGAWELSLLKVHHFHAGVRRAATEAITAATAAAASTQTATPWSSSSFRVRDYFNKAGKGLEKEVAMDDHWDFLKLGFGGMFTQLPRLNPLHAMIRRAAREKRGQRTRLYFIDRYGNVGASEGEGRDYKSQFWGESTHSRQSLNEDLKGTENVSFQKYFRDTRAHKRKLSLCRELQRSRAILKMYASRHSQGKQAALN